MARTHSRKLLILRSTARAELLFSAGAKPFSAAC
jgi:hypothetical protein